LAFGVPYSLDLALNFSQDIWGSYDGYTYLQWSSLWMKATIGNPLTSTYGYMGGASTYGWRNTYGTAKSLMQHLCLEFGVVPYYMFGTTSGLIDINPANNGHRIILRARGNRNTSTNILILTGKIIKSDFVSSTPRRTGNIRYVFSENSNHSDWFWKNIYHYGASYPSDVQFDIDVNTDFGINEPSLSDTLNTTRLLYTGAQPMESRETVSRWMWHKYSTGQDIEGIMALRTAMTQYLYYCFSRSRFEFTRIYTSLKADNGSMISQRTIQCLTSTDFTFLLNGVSTTKTFYASEVKKDIVNNKLTVIWVQA
jgi:hypothetical protein